MKSIRIWATFAFLMVLISPPVVMSEPAGPPSGLEVNVVKPLPLPVTGAVNVANAPEVTVLNDENNPVSVTLETDGLSVNVSTIYRFVGLTEGNTTGSGSGPIGMNAKCSSDFSAQARMCTTKEFFESGISSDLETDAWIAPAISTMSDTTSSEGKPAKFVILAPGTGLTITEDNFWHGYLSCSQWGLSAGDYYGTIVTVNGKLWFDSCDESYPVACCLPAVQTP